jgi:hypothetical protein
LNRSSSTNVNPHGPGRQVSSPVLTRPFAAEELGSNFTLSDHLPSRALVSATSSPEALGEDVRDGAFTVPKDTVQTASTLTEINVLDTFCIFFSVLLVCSNKIVSKLRREMRAPSIPVPPFAPGPISHLQLASSGAHLLLAFAVRTSSLAVTTLAS